MVRAPVHGHWHLLLYARAEGSMVIRGTGNGADGTFASRPEASSWSRAIVSQYYRQGYVGEVQNQPAASKIFVWGNPGDSSISFGC